MLRANNKGKSDACATGGIYQSVEEAVGRELCVKPQFPSILHPAAQLCFCRMSKREGEKGRVSASVVGKQSKNKVKHLVKEGHGQVNGSVTMSGRGVEHRKCK